jgi:hypothetical protein
MEKLIEKAIVWPGHYDHVDLLMLCFFNKLNWKWLSTGIGVCFAINLVPSIISFVSGSASC